jgi:hypothetical protein
VADPNINSIIPKDQHDLTVQLRDKIIQQVTESAQVQMDLRKWYSLKLCKEVSQLKLDDCPALLRVMQIIRLLRESQLELEQSLEEPRGQV